MVSCLMMVSLVVSSCGQKEAEEEVKVTEEGGQIITTKEEVEKKSEEVSAPVEEAVEVTLTRLDGTKMVKTVKKAKYGGTFVRTGGDPQGWNPFVRLHQFTGQSWVTQEELITGDWSKGPAGTYETDLIFGFGGQMKYMTGWLAESWDLPDGETIIFHIRQGVHWWNKPPTNGRELTAEDVVWTIDKAFTSPNCWFYVNLTALDSSPTSVKVLDKYTVEVKVPPKMQGVLLLEIGDKLYQFPKDITEQVDLDDWKNAIGTGPWMLTDYVPSVSQTYTRNPNYWQFDPLQPENQLPYPDQSRLLNIPDVSTQMAAFRTGNLDLMEIVGWENAQNMLKENPDIQYNRRPVGGMSLLSGRQDKDLPFKDIRVRQAMNMAIDRQELIDDYYQGNAELVGYPVPNVKSFSSFYLTYEDLPASVQELFTYNPEKAKSLLAEAGYPNGFKTVVQCASGNVDFVALLQDYLGRINIDVTVEPVEQAIFGGIQYGHNHKEMIYGMSSNWQPIVLMDVRKGNMWNVSGWTDQRINDAYEGISQAMGKDDDAVTRIMREIAPFILENAWAVWLPSPYSYSLWWPWVQNYHGEWDIGFSCQMRGFTYTWVDTDMKRSMGY